MFELRADADAVLTPTYAARAFTHPVPKFRLPADGLSADAAYRLIVDELNLDGNPLLNLATFVTSWMEPTADALAADTLAKNMIDQDEYPQTQVIHERVVNIIARLFNAPHGSHPTGTATIGSSEAIMLGLLAHKRSWRARREAAGAAADSPNMVVGADVHTSWEKFARYFEVELRIAPMRPDHYTLTADDVEPLIDENTIAVGAVLATTFTGGVDDIGGIDALIGRLQEQHGWEIPLHIDAATGGFVFPFSEPEFEWDFRLPHVQSINVSNHKFGLVYPGMGTLVFRDQSVLPEDLVFHINYLGGDMPNYSLNFSRPSSEIVLQYFNFLRLGRSGYERIVSSVLSNARHLATALKRSEHLELINDGSRAPIVVARASDPQALDLSAVSRLVRERGWIVPAYTLPADASDITVLRMVIRENVSRDMTELLAHDLDNAIADALDHGAGHGHRPRRRPHC